MLLILTSHKESKMDRLAPQALVSILDDVLARIPRMFHLLPFHLQHHPTPLISCAAAISPPESCCCRRDAFTLWEELTLDLETLIPKIEACC